MIRYYILVDESTQWFSKLVALEEGAKEPREQIDIPQRVMRGRFFANIFERAPLEKTLLLYGQMGGQSWGGWNISPMEYKRIFRIIELCAAEQEYQKLQEYNV